MSKFLDYASQCYYEGEPVISDAEFDSLAAQCNYNKVGYSVTDGIAHRFQMYSLQKCFDPSEVANILGTDELVETPKLDGAAISLLYVNGNLALALTRGDGIIGRDITDKALAMSSIPSQVLERKTFQVTGEVVCPSSVENARNVASGSLNLKDMSEFATRDITFVAYDVQGLEFDTYESTLSFLHLHGFEDVGSFDSSNYPTDGTVYRVVDNKVFKRLGHTSKHPRGALALKTVYEGVHTKLLNVEWQVGKSGVVSPVAVLEPVQIGDATVSKATLHNIEYIRELNLEIGCMVEVIRSGEIIPRIVRRVDI